MLTWWEVWLRSFLWAMPKGLLFVWELVVTWWLFVMQWGGGLSRWKHYDAQGQLLANGTPEWALLRVLPTIIMLRRGLGESIGNLWRRLRWSHVCELCGKLLQSCKVHLQRMSRTFFKFDDYPDNDDCVDSRHRFSGKLLNWWLKQEETTVLSLLEDFLEPLSALVGHFHDWLLMARRNLVASGDSEIRIHTTRASLLCWLSTDQLCDRSRSRFKIQLH